MLLDLPLITLTYLTKLIQQKNTTAKQPKQTKSEFKKSKELKEKI